MQKVQNGCLKNRKFKCNVILPHNLIFKNWGGMPKCMYVVQSYWRCHHDAIMEYQHESQTKEGNTTHFVFSKCIPNCKTRPLKKKNAYFSNELIIELIMHKYGSDQLEVRTYSMISKEIQQKPHKNVNNFLEKMLFLFLFA